MPIHQLKLTERREVARGTIEFVFEKPAGLTFIPGQYAGFTLINPTETDAGGITRRFSLLSTPNESHIRFTTRIQNSAYKRVLNSLAIGDMIKFAGPTGNFTLHEDKTIPAVFIAGGIGVTPFYSMIQYAKEQQSSQPLFLFYGNQNADESSYMDEIKQLQTQNPHFTFIPTLAHPHATWQGETGFITHTMIKKYIVDLSIPFFYICGSPAMVTALQETLVEMGISSDKIKVEDFPGY